MLCPRGPCIEVIRRPAGLEALAQAAGCQVGQGQCGRAWGTVWKIAELGQAHLRGQKCDGRKGRWEVVHPVHQACSRSREKVARALGTWILDTGSWILTMDQTTIQVRDGERKVGMCKWHSILHCNSTVGSPPPETCEPLSDRDLDRRKGLPPTPTSS